MIIGKVVGGRDDVRDPVQVEIVLRIVVEDDFAIV